FLMAIATDSIHIFNEFYFRCREGKNKKTAILETMAAVGRPVRYTALATAAGFGVLVFMHIIPVKIFGALVGFGTVILRLLSFSLIPAVLSLLKEEKIRRASMREDIDTSPVSQGLKRLAGLGANRPKATVLAGLLLLGVAVMGTTKIIVNNNMVEWFKYHSEVRTADRVMNQALGGTSLGYIVAIAPEAESIKTPEAMRSIEGLQRYLEKLPAVGKTTSVVDYVKRINRVLHQDDPGHETVPETKEIIGQYLFLFSMSAKPSDLDNVVDYPFQKANVWVQLKTWDAQAMRDVIGAVKDYRKTNPTPMEFKPAGIAYFNLVWNDEVLGDTVRGFLLALLAVFAILVLNYFSIHFISRLQQRLAEKGSGLTDALLWTAARPGKGILRNALLFASAFAVMLFAPLTPYVTVGDFIVSMMLLSAILTILYLPALITLGKGWLFTRRV
ncbi:MAG: MMPL family transporter, partial [Nitrospirae bacterium]|nr:MMPL family transporter [Nitrospirota bacterium]